MMPKTRHPGGKAKTKAKTKVQIASLPADLDPAALPEEAVGCQMQHHMRASARTIGNCQGLEVLTRLTHRFIDLRSDTAPRANDHLLTRPRAECESVYASQINGLPI